MNIIRNGGGELGEGDVHVYSRGGKGVALSADYGLAFDDVDEVDSRGAVISVS